jgi:hypothetical protein
MVSQPGDLEDLDAKVKGYTLSEHTRITGFDVFLLLRTKSLGSNTLGTNN